MDPDRPGDYYRSVVGKLSLRTQDVTGAPFADTSADPATMQVPGNASPAADGAPVYGSVESAVAGTDPVATLGTDAHGARRRAGGRHAPSTGRRSTACTPTPSRAG